MLEAMSNILAFSMEDKLTLGLAKKTTIEPEQKGRFGERLISFFLQDEDDE